MQLSNRTLEKNMQGHADVENEADYSYRFKHKVSTRMGILFSLMRKKNDATHQNKH